MASSTPATADSAFDPALAYKFVAEQVSFGPRVPGSPAHARAIEWIRDQLQRAGWSVELQEFTYRNVKLTNVIGRSPGQSRPWIILGAHFDTRPVADQDPGDPAQPVTGANDGASGVAVLLALAHALPPDSMPCEIWLAFFDAEDSGGINDWEWFVGSSYMAESLAGDPNAVVIADMVGDADLQLYQERNSDPEITASIWETAADLGQEGFIPEPKHSILDDHIPFIRRGIPAVDIIDFDYPHWHTTQDTLDKVSAESLNQVGETLRTWLIGQCRLSD
jgi:Zn-dependent M28 family amino/carboxypeptidase